MACPGAAVRRPVHGRLDVSIVNVALPSIQTDLGFSQENFLGEEGTERIRAAYPGKTWDRLVAVKRRYDPTNLFRLNQNVSPD
jgi:Berberine and berberine like